jgi:hypothetical protein
MDNLMVQAEELLSVKSLQAAFFDLKDIKDMIVL